MSSEDRATAESAAADFIAVCLAEAVRERGLATLAISGGSTPWGMFERLAACDLPWNGIHFLQVDERIVPLDHEARNWRQFLANPLAQCVPDSNRHAMPVEIDDPCLAASQYANTLTKCAGDPPDLDVVHLGIGEDGHTASLFAGDPLLEEMQRWVGVSRRHQDHRRMSLTLPALNRSRCIAWFAVGESRRDAVRRLLAGDRAIPAARVERSRAICFTDIDATPGRRIDMKGYVTNIERDTLANSDYRRVLFTGPNTQLVLMTLQPGVEIGLEKHDEHDQFIRVEAGAGVALLDGAKHELSNGVAVVIPAGVAHNVVNTSRDAPLRLYTLYSPPEHADGTVHRTKRDDTGH